MRVGRGTIHVYGISWGEVSDTHAIKKKKKWSLKLHYELSILELNQESMTWVMES